MHVSWVSTEMRRHRIPSFFKNFILFRIPCRIAWNSAEFRGIPCHIFRTNFAESRDIFMHGMTDGQKDRQTDWLTDCSTIFLILGGNLDTKLQTEFRMQKARHAAEFREILLWRSRGIPYLFSKKCLIPPEVRKASVDTLLLSRPANKFFKG